MTDLLFINWNVNPEIFHIGSFAVRWYSLLFISGFFIGWYIFKWFFRREGVPVTLLEPLLGNNRPHTCDVVVFTPLRKEI